MTKQVQYGTQKKKLGPRKQSAVPEKKKRFDTTASLKHLKKVSSNGLRFLKPLLPLPSLLLRSNCLLLFITDSCFSIYFSKFYIFFFTVLCQTHFNFLGWTPLFLFLFCWLNVSSSLLWKSWTLLSYCFNLISFKIISLL